MGDYEHTIADINFALSLGYPEETRYKLYERLGKCQIKLGNPIKAKPSLLIAGQLIKRSNLEESRKKVLLEGIEKLQAEAKKAPTKQSNENNDTVFKENGDDPGLGDKLVVESNDQVGRYVVAKQDLDANETVLVEKPFASVLNMDKQGLNCHNCFRRLVAAVPCMSCSGVAFCSTTCRDEASGCYKESEGHQKYHNFECQFLEVMTGLGCSQVAKLALRMITAKPYKYYLSLKGRLTSKEVYEGEDYLRIYQLVGLNGQRWPEERLARASMSVLLLSILKASNYFGNVQHNQIINACGDSFSANETYIGSLILHNLQVLQFNAHEVYELVRGTRNDLKPWKHVPIGLAIYPTASNFNHSCHAGVARYFNGKEMVLKTLHPIKSGQEVAENYGYAFYLKTRSERRKELSARYWFDCRCLSCVQNWPLLDKLPVIQPPEVMKLYDKGLEFMSKGDAGDAAQCFQQGLQILYKSSPTIGNLSQEMVRIEDKLRTCVANMGNVIYAEDLITNSKK